MNLLRIARKNLLRQWSGSLLSILLLMFGVAGILLLLKIEKQLEERFERNIKGINLVLGAPGSPLQLILSAVYQIDAPTGNIPAGKADFLVKNPLIEKAIPLAYGDNYGGFRIVGSTPAYPEHYDAKIAQGRMFETHLEAVLGASTAKYSGLKTGDTFYSAHGFDDTQDVHENVGFTVVGILEPSGSVLDQLILCTLESVWMVHPQEDSAELKREYTAVLLTQRNPTAMVTLPEMARLNGMQIALPSIEMNRLTQNFGIGKAVLEKVAGSIILLSLLSIFVSLLSSLKDRKYELAIMRAMGAGRRKLFFLIQLEGLILSIIGFTLGYLLSVFGLWMFGQMLESEFKYSIEHIQPDMQDFFILMVTVGVGLAASLLPAIKASSTDISQTLSNA